VLYVKVLDRGCNQLVGVVPRNVVTREDGWRRGE